MVFITIVQPFAQGRVLSIISGRQNESAKGVSNCSAVSHLVQVNYCTRRYKLRQPALDVRLYLKYSTTRGRTRRKLSTRRGKLQRSSWSLTTLNSRQLFPPAKTFLPLVPPAWPSKIYNRGWSHPRSLHRRVYRAVKISPVISVAVQFEHWAIWSSSDTSDHNSDSAHRIPAI